MSEFELADAHADEAERGMTDGGGHAANLTIFSLDQFERDPGVRDILPKSDRRLARRDEGSGNQRTCGARQCTIVAEVDSSPRESSERGVIRRTLDLRPIFTAVLSFGI